MSNSFQSIQSGLAELKNYYQGPIVDQFNEDIPIYRGAEKGKHPWSGYQVIRPLKVRRNQGIGATSDGGPLPAIGKQTTIQAQITSAFNYLRFGITGPMIKASANDTGSFVRGVAFELKEGYNDIQVDANRQCSWNGDGTLGRMNAGAVASTAVTIKGRQDGEPALQFIDVDGVYDIYTSVGVLVQSGVTVSSISSGTASSTTATLIVSPAVTASTDNVWVRANSYGQEVKGLLYQLDGLTTTVFNIDRAQYPQTQGNVLDLANQQLTLDYMQQQYNEAMRRAGAKLSAIWSDFNSLRYYQKLLTPDKRYNNTVQGDGGFAAKDKFFLDFNGCPIVPDQSCPKTMIFLPPEVITKYVLCELEFADETGSMLLAQTGADSFEARIRLFFQLFNEKAAATSRLTGYTSP